MLSTHLIYYRPNGQLFPLYFGYC